MGSSSPPQAEQPQLPCFPNQDKAGITRLGWVGAWGFKVLPTLQPSVGASWPPLALLNDSHTLQLRPTVQRPGQRGKGMPLDLALSLPTFLGLDWLDQLEGGMGSGGHTLHLPHV